MPFTDLTFAQEILSLRKTCRNCWYGRSGSCSMQSCGCVTQVFNHADMPFWWLSFEDGEERESRLDSTS